MKLFTIWKTVSFLLLFTICCNCLALAQQVGIGTKTPNASAVLDLASDTLGLLVPRMTAAQRDAIPSPATGLLVFVNTDSSFYYREGGGWKKITVEGESWKLGGNGNATAKFLGTKDTSALRFRTKNLERMILDSNGRMGMNTSDPISSLHIVDNGSLTGDITLEYHSAIGNYPVMGFRKSGGTPAAKLATDSNSILGVIDFSGYDGQSWRSVGDMVGITENNYATGQYRSSLHFSTNNGTNLEQNIKITKSAFRAGVANGTQWSTPNIGVASVGLGINVVANTYGSVSIGEANIAETNPYAVAIGRQNHSSGYASLAMGHFSEATGGYAVSIGLRDTVSGYGASSLGGYNKVFAAYGFAAGFSNTVTGENATALGSNNFAPSYGEMTVGNYATTYTPLSAAGINAADRVFTIGNGANLNTRSNAMVVLKNGNVGIGLANPANTLQVTGGFMTSSTSGSFRVHPFFGGGATTLLATFESIGTSGPQVRFKTSTADFVDIGMNSTGGFVVERNDNPYFVVHTNGNVGIGTTTPNTKLQVTGVINATGYMGHAGTADLIAGNVINWDWTGTQLQGWVDNTQVGILSDRRLKSNINPLKGSAIVKLMTLNPVSFNYKKIEGTVFTGSPVLQEGFIADELQEVIPSAVNGQKDALTDKGDIQPQTINLMPLVSVLTKAMQEQQAQIEKLQALVQKQQVQIGQLLKR